jgi:hypothetical protein
MEIKNNFVVPLPPDEAWRVLIDIPRIAPCMPGAELTNIIDDRSFKGNVAVKLGPVALVFSGTARFEEVDDQAHTARVKAQGSDTKGRGGASAAVSFALSAVPEGTRVDVVTDISLSGMVAQYGRGIGIIQALATQLVNQFASALHTMLAQDDAPARRFPDRATMDKRGAPISEPVEPATGFQSRPSKPISAFSLLFTAIWNAITRLFKGGRTT